MQERWSQVRFQRSSSMIERPEHAFGIGTVRADLLKRKVKPLR